MGEHQAEISKSIDDFFIRCNLSPETRLDCHAFLEALYPGQPIEPTHTQGYCSYTVTVNEHIVQFRPSCYSLDLRVTDAAREVHNSLAPATIYLGVLEHSGLLAYRMEKLQGISYKAFRSKYGSDVSAVRMTVCEDLASFMAQSWLASRNSNLVRGKIGKSIRSRLTLLEEQLPVRFRHVARDLWSKIDAIEALPLVLTHGDLVPSNILLDPDTGHLLGIVDWAEAEELPFGTCLYGLDEILGYVSDGRFVYHSDAEQARNAFWRRLKAEIPELAHTDIMRAVLLARDLGILLWHGFAFDDGAIDRVVQEGRDDEEICYLDALLFHNVQI
jgi:hypothetical protein